MHQQAIDDFSSAIRINPDNVAAYNNRGNVYGKLDVHQLAIDNFSNAIRINPDYADAYLNRGITKEKFGKYYCDDYKKACELGEKKACSWFSSQCK